LSSNLLLSTSCLPYRGGKMSVLVEFAIFPTDKGESVSAYVSRVLRMFKEGEIPYRLTPMGTVFETETMDEALGLIGKAYAELAPDCRRVYVTATFDIRQGLSNRMEGKIASIEEKIGKVAS